MYGQNDLLMLQTHTPGSFKVEMIHDRLNGVRKGSLPVGFRYQKMQPFKDLKKLKLKMSWDSLSKTPLESEIVTSVITNTGTHSTNFYRPRVLPTLPNYQQSNAMETILPRYTIKKHCEYLLKTNNQKFQSLNSDLLIKSYT